jgi:hypothetical protein
MERYLLRLPARTAWILAYSLWGILFGYGVVRSLLDREWGYAALCSGVVLVLAWRLFLAIRSPRVSLVKESGPISGHGYRPPPIEPR